MKKEPAGKNIKNAIIVHGKPGKKEQLWRERTNNPNSKAHWLGWLKEKLDKKGIEAQSPEMPKPYFPEWESWSKEINKSSITKRTVLVGHSCGGGFWVKYLSLNKELMPGKVILVAPWLDPDGDETDGFFEDFEIDPKLTERTQLIIFNSDNDMGNVHKSVAMIREALPAAEYKEFHKYGHFTYGQMHTREFPELLSECLKTRVK